MRLTHLDLETFAAWSGDCNPLHVDPQAAAQTSYGRPIAHGMLVCLEALKQAERKHFDTVRTLDVEFHAPVFPDQDYEVECRPGDSVGQLEVRRGDDVLLRLTVGTRLPVSPQGSRRESPFAADLRAADPRGAEPHAADSGPASAHQPGPLRDHADPGILAQPDMDLSWVGQVGPGDCRDVPADLSIDQLGRLPRISGRYARPVPPEAVGQQGVLSARQAGVLGLCSYLVGMELPGLRSVFTRLRLEFHEPLGPSSPLVYRAAVTRFDANFRLLDTQLEVATADGRPVASGSVRSYVRFSPVVTDVRQLAAVLESRPLGLRGQVALVCGGSRGLGAELAASLAVAGCHVYLNCRRTTEAVETLVRQLRQRGAQVELLTGDVGDPRWCASTRALLAERHQRLDLLVLNACGPPVVAGLTGLGDAAEGSYVADNLRLVQTPLAALLPLVEACGGAVVGVSSSFVTQPPPELASYVTLKHAMEGLVRAAAAEFPRARYLLPRPPRLQTSWNDTPTGVLGTRPAWQAAVNIVTNLPDSSSSGQVLTLDEFPSIASPLSELPGPDLPVATDAAGREPDPRKLVLAASFTVEPLLPGLQFWKRELGWSVDLETSPYGQLIQELLNPASGLNTNRQGWNAILLRVADWMRELPAETRESTDRLQACLESTADEFVRALLAHRQRSAAETLLMLCPAAKTTPPDQRDLLERTEQQLLEQLRGTGGLTVLRASDFHALYAVQDSLVDDPLRDRIAHVPYRDGYLGVLSTRIARHLHRRLAPVRKVLVVDCDNTLWNGVVGEVGVEGVTFDSSHRLLHETLNRLSENGVLICLCSKNEPADVWSVFERRDWTLPRERIVAAMINWQSKSQNLRALADRLNLGIDSFVFLDDNPVECAEVRAACPEVLTLEWPRQSESACRLLRHTWELDLVEGTSEDRWRTQRYQQEFQRRELQQGQASFRDFLERLELVVDIQPLSGPDLPRASQLTLRTNQFNFTTRRREVGPLQALGDDPEYACRTVRVRDRFGDYGLVGLLIARRRPPLLEVDTFLLSCRVLGRGVEWAMAAELGRLAAEQGLERVRFRVERTRKNTPAWNFLEAITPQEARQQTDEVLECELAAEDVRQLRFEPNEDEPAAGQPETGQAAAGESDAGESKAGDSDEGESKAGAGAGRDAAGAAGPAEHFLSLEMLRQRERQIARTAESLSSIAPLEAAIRGEVTGGPAVKDAASDDDVERVVYDVFSAALKIPVGQLRQVDALEPLGCDSFKIVEITVALVERFPWLPPTLLFEHRKLSQIVEAIAGRATAGRAIAGRATAGRATAGGGPSEAEQALPSGRPVVPGRPADQPLDIAVVGMHLRCGGADGVDRLWQLLSGGHRAVRRVPVDRPQFLGRLRDNRPHWAGLLEGVEHFDAEFFGVSPREAEFMDPQLRQLLEVAWTALEDAGLARAGEHADTGVFVGAMYGDYRFPANAASARTGKNFRSWEAFSLANRLSQTFGFRGPSLAVDTACSSSGTALHLACQALRNGECEAAVVGGINLILDPDRFVQLGRLGILSPTGECRAFGQEADGTVLGEGVGVVVLRPLADALRRGDRIHGVIKGTAVSTGAGSVGFTVPNPQAQAEAIRRCLRESGLDPRTITYVETHGTGTSLGDPIEVRGLALAHGDRELWDRAIQGSEQCRLGSIKPNIGHLEAGAGILGLIKVLLQFQHRQLLPSLTSERLNDQIPFGELPFTVQRTLDPWRRPVLEIAGRATEVPRRAGLSSFGVGGANAHLLLEEPPEVEPPVESAEPCVHVLSLSAAHRDTLRERAGQFHEYLERPSSPRLRDVCFTANGKLAPLEHRLAVVAENREQMLRSLGAAAEQESFPGLFQGRASRGDSPRVAFLFTGQGSQYAGMGQELYGSEPVFRESLERCADLLRPLIGCSLQDVMFAPPDSPAAERIHQTGFTQPALFALQYALSQLWASWGVRPDLVLGHSVGEIAALCVAGGISLEDGVQLIAARGRLMQALPPGGRMISLQTTEARVREAVSGRETQLSVAAVNAPGQVVVSGQGQAVAEIAARFEADGVKVRELSVSHAFHSPLMEPMIAEYQAVAAGLHFARPTIPFVSCVEAGQVSDEVTRTEYWGRQVRDAVRFHEAVAALDRQGPVAYVELGPHPVLLGLARLCLPDAERLWLPSIRKGSEARRTMRESLAQLYVRGLQPDWDALDDPAACRQVTLPAYPFRRKRYWLREPKAAERALAGTRQESGSHQESGARQESGTRRDAVGQSLLYELIWKPRERRDANSERRVAGHWILLADCLAAAEPLARALEARGVTASVVLSARAESNGRTHRYVVDADSRSDLERVLRQVRSEGGAADGIACLWGLDGRSNVNAAEADSETDSETDSASELLERGLHLVQVLDGCSDSDPASLWLVTRGAVPAGETSRAIAVHQAPLWAFGRVASLECPRLSIAMLDLPEDEEALDQRLWERVAHECTVPDGEEQLAFRRGKRYVARLKPVTGASADGFAAGSFGARDDAAYLITGGLGALGQHLARWLVDRGARHLVLAGRRGASEPQAVALVDELRVRGARVEIVQADVSREQDVVRLLSPAANGPPLAGIFHAAGVDQVKPIREMNVQDLRTMLAAKARGAWLLHQHTRDRALDVFVCMSSISSVWGSAGRAHYAAANGFLDALVHQRRHEGLPGLSVNWGPWGGGGMASPASLRELERIGNRALVPQTALTLLESLLAGRHVQAVVADMNWERFRPIYEARRNRPLLAELSDQGEASGQAAGVQEAESGEAENLEIWRELSDEQRTRRVASLLRDELARTLGLENSEELDSERSFFDMGLDSLMAVELASRLRQRFGIQEASLIFQHPRLDELSQRVAQRLAETSPVAGNGQAGNGQAGNGQTGSRQAGSGKAGNGQTGRGRADSSRARRGDSHGRAVGSGSGLAGVGEGGSDGPVRDSGPEPDFEPVPDFGPVTDSGPVPDSERVASDPGDLEARVVAFQRAAYPHRDVRLIGPRWRWMFLESARRLGVSPLLWTREADGRVVAFHGGIPVRVQIGGKERTSAWFVESMVLESYRVQALGTQLLLESKRDLPFSLSLGQTAEMRGMLLKLGWQEVAPLQTLVLPLRPGRMLAGKFHPLVTGAMSAGLIVAGSAQRLARGALRTRLVCRQITRFGAAHDALWQAVRREYPCAAERNAGYLNWKYVDQPGQDFLRLELSCDRRVVALAVVQFREPDAAYRYRRAVLVDVVASPSNRRLLHAMFRAVEAACREHETDSLLFHVIHSGLEAAARGYGFLRRAPTRHLLVCPDGLSADDRQRVLDRRNWLITLGDSDTDRPW